MIIIGRERGAAARFWSTGFYCIVAAVQYFFLFFLAQVGGGGRRGGASPNYVSAAVRN